MNLLSYTLFKTGTHSLKKILRNVLDTSIYNLEFKHIHNLKRKDFDIIFITIRSHLNIYPSAFFQDITKPQYEYSYFREDINKNIKYTKEYYKENKLKLIKEYKENKEEFMEKLISYFLTINWSKYSNINYKFIKIYLNQILEEQLENIEYNKGSYKILNTYHKIMKKNIKIVFLDLHMLNNKEEIKKMFEELELEFDEDKVNGLNSFSGREKWYSNMYRDLKKGLKESNYYEKYKHMDDILHDSQ